MNKRLCEACNNVSFCNWLKEIPYYHDFKVSKNIMKTLPKCFQETPLGELKGAINQYRGPHESHVHEYNDTWIIHRDKVDPRFDPIGHLINDAPHILVLGSFVALGFLGLALAIGGEKK